METKNTNVMLQQGDVNIWGSCIPPKATPRKSPIVAEGEATGHMHKVVGTDFEMLELGDRIFARILSGDCAIVHEEHKTIMLPPGEYEFGPTYEYDYETKEARRVQD